MIIWDSALTGHQIDRISRPLSGTSPLIHPITVALEFLLFEKDSPQENSFSANPAEEYQEELEELIDLQSQTELCSQHLDCPLRSWYDPLSQPHTPSSDYQHLLSDIENAVTNCKPPATRLDLYAEGSVLGHIESLYKWSMLIGFGSEIPSNPCGIEEFISFSQQYHQVLYSEEEEGCSYISEGIISDQVKAVVGLMIAADFGHSEAYIPLSTFISSGIGLGIFSLDFESSHGRCILKKIVESVPLPPSASHDGNSSYSLFSHAVEVPMNL